MMEYAQDYNLKIKRWFYLLCMQRKVLVCPERPTLQRLHEIIDKYDRGVIEELQQLYALGVLTAMQLMIIH